MREGVYETSKAIERNIVDSWLDYFCTTRVKYDDKNNVHERKRDESWKAEEKKESKDAMYDIHHFEPAAADFGSASGPISLMLVISLSTMPNFFASEAVMYVSLSSAAFTSLALLPLCFTMILLSASRVCSALWASR